jgi:hypothetical protein
VPCHRSISVLPLLVEPTAQTLLADVAATLLRLPARLGLGACFHAEPYGTH